jgi:hypothetical protein
MRETDTRAPRRILVLDIGGTHVKVRLPGRSTVVRIPSGPSMDPEKMTKRLRKRLKGVRYDAVAMGYPGLVVHGRIVREPPNLGKGWVGFDFSKAFGRPTRIINDAAMQALGSYRGGRMLFLGLGTGFGSAMIVSGEIEPMELAHLPYKKGRTYEDFVGDAALQRLGRKKWQKEVFGVVRALTTALEPDYVVLGGGNARKLKELPPGACLGDNRYAFDGGVRLWTGGGRVGSIERVSALSNAATVRPGSPRRPGSRRGR